MGRAFKWIGLVALVVFAVWGVVLTWRVYKPFDGGEKVYRAEGMLRVAHARKPIGGDETDSFDVIAQTQAVLVTSRPIIELAMKRPEFLELGLPADGVTAQRMARSVTAEHPAQTELIRVYYTDRDKRVAGKMVRAIVHALVEYDKKQSGDQEATRLKVLEDAMGRLSERIGAIDHQIMQIASKFGISNLQNLLEAKQEEEAKFEARLHEAELELELARRWKESHRGLDDMSEGEIAILDTVFRACIQDRNDAMVELEGLKARGHDTNNPQTKAAQLRYEAAAKKVEQYKKDWIELQKQLAGDPPIGNPGWGPRGAPPLATLEAMVKDIRNKYEEVRKSRVEVGQGLIRYGDLMREREDLVKERLALRGRIDQICREVMMFRRVTILDEGTEPTEPYIAK